MNRIRTWAPAIVLAAGLTCTAVLAQVPASSKNNLLPPLYTAPAPLQDLQIVNVAAPYPSNPYQLHAQSSQLAQQYVKAEKDEEKSQLRKKLTDLLNREFELQQQRQQKELEELEKEMKRLRDLLNKRKENKESIVTRRFEQLVHEAEGLGWNAPGGPHPMYGPANEFVAPATRAPAKP